MFRRSVFTLAIWLCLIGCLLASTETDEQTANKAVNDAINTALDAIQVINADLVKANAAVKEVNDFKDSKEKEAIKAAKDAVKRASQVDSAKQLATKATETATKISANRLEAFNKANGAVGKAGQALRNAEKSLGDAKDARNIQPTDSDYTARKEKADAAKKMAEDAISSLSGNVNLLTESAEILNKAKEAANQTLILTYQVDATLYANDARLNHKYASDFAEHTKNKVADMEKMTAEIRQLLAKAPTEAAAEIVRDQISAAERAIQNSAPLVQDAVNAVQTAKEQKDKVDDIVKALNSESDVEAAANLIKEAKSAADAALAAQRKANNAQNNVIVQLQYVMNARAKALEVVSGSESSTGKDGSTAKSIYWWNVLAIMVMVTMYTQ